MEPNQKTAGQLSHQALKDNTKYDSMEVGEAITADVAVQLRITIENHRNIIDENEFCLVRLISKDTLLSNLIRNKYYAWPYLPKPRPNQSVWLYNKGLDRVTKRLWILPNAMVMAELHSLHHVSPKYKMMKAWTDAFYKGWKFVKGHFADETGAMKYYGKFVNTDPSYFWEFIRKDQNIDLLSEHEYMLKHREELIQAGCKEPDTNFSEPFDVSKIFVKKVADSAETAIK